MPLIKLGIQLLLIAEEHTQLYSSFLQVVHSNSRSSGSWFISAVRVLEYRTTYGVNCVWPAYAHFSSNQTSFLICLLLLNCCTSTRLFISLLLFSFLISRCMTPSTSTNESKAPVLSLSYNCVPHHIKKFEFRKKSNQKTFTYPLRKIHN